MTCLAKKIITVGSLWTVGQYNVTRAPDTDPLQVGTVEYTLTDGTVTLSGVLPWNPTYQPVPEVTGAFVLFDVDTSTLVRGNSYWLSYTLDGQIIPFSAADNVSRIKIKAV